MKTNDDDGHSALVTLRLLERANPVKPASSKGTCEASNLFSTQQRVLVSDNPFTFLFTLVKNAKQNPQFEFSLLTNPNRRL